MPDQYLVTTTGGVIFFLRRQGLSARRDKVFRLHLQRMDIYETFTLISAKTDTMTRTRSGTGLAENLSIGGSFEVDKISGTEAAEIQH